jgi:oligopeptide transport system substrate-binding protein
VEAHGDQWTKLGKIVTNGPFLLKEWRLNQHIRFVKNPDYWDAGHVRLSTVDALAVESANTGFNLYLTGAADYTGTVPLPLRDLVRARPDYHTGVYLATYYYLFNVRRKPLNDPRVRKALAMAIDKASICKYITRGGEVPARTFVPEGMPGYTGPKGLTPNPELARTLLAQAGFPDGKGFPRLQVLYNTSETHRDIAEVIQQMWKTNLNIRVDILNQEWKVYLDSTDRGEYDVARAAWIGDYTDPNTFLDMWVTGGGNNRSGWSNKRYDDLIRRAALEGDAQRRMKIFRDAETILVEEEMPILPIYYFVTNEMYRANVKGIYQNVRGVHPMKWIYVER